MKLHYTVLDARGNYATEAMCVSIDAMLYDALPSIGPCLYESLKSVNMLNTYRMVGDGVNSLLLYGCDGWNIIIMYDNKFNVISRQDLRQF